MDYSKGWHEGMALEDERNLAYWERNMLALFMACEMNYIAEESGCTPDNGWYYDTDNNWDGWKRVISLIDGKITFHVPDDFDMGNLLPEIKPNWDGHSTEEKWNRLKTACECKGEK